MAGTVQESVDIVGQLATNLLHPLGPRIGRDPRDVHTSCFQMHHGHDVVRYQSGGRPDFDGREIRREQRVPVSFQKGTPRR